MQTILITGINGFLGSHLARRLYKEYKIIGLEKGQTASSRLEDIQNQIKVFDVDKHSIAEIIQSSDISYVIHAATYYGRENVSFAEIINSNIIFPSRLSELANQNNIKLFINTDTFFNTNSITYTYLSDYALSKKHAVEWLQMQAGNMPFVNLKLQHMFGPMDAPTKFVPQIIKSLLNNEKEVNLTKGEQKRDFIYIGDVVSAFEAVVKNYQKLNTGFTELEVGVGDSISIRDFVEIVHKKTQSTSVLNFGALPYRENEIMDSVADIDTWMDIDWRPEIPLESGLEKTIMSLKQLS